MLFASLRLLGGTLLFLAMAATVGIPTGGRGPVAAQPSAEPLLGLDLYRPVADDNPLTAEKAALGRRLFHERLLSRDRKLSCAGCHDPERGFTNGKAVAEGAYGRLGKRNVPALFNRAWGRSFFWDGRAPTLEAQAVQPITSPFEMDMTMQEVAERLSREPEYVVAFRQAFGRGIQEDDPARVLACYVRTILSADSPYDRHLAGRPDALSLEAQEGLRIFRGKGNCTACHAGPHLTDEEFHNTGVAWRNGRWLDAGRFAVTGIEADLGKFKTPSLREVARTAPYMHDGSIPSLEEVIEYYDRGGSRNPRLDQEVKPLHLSAEEKHVLAAFLRSLSGRVAEGL